MRRLPPLAFALALAACVAPPTIAVRRAADFRLADGRPTRIAILPFHDHVPHHGWLWHAGRPFVWLGRLAMLKFGDSEPSPSVMAEELRTLLAARLQGPATAIVNPAQIDVSLAQLPDAFDRDDPVALAEALDVDAVLIGELDELGADWFVLSTRRRLGGELRLLAGDDGRELFGAVIAIDDDAGLVRVPTGYVSLVAAPLAAVSTGPYTEMAVAWVERAGVELFARPADSAPDGTAPLPR